MNGAQEAGKGKATIKHMTNAIKQYAKYCDKEFTGKDLLRIKAVEKKVKRQCRDMGRGQAEGAGWNVADRVADIAAKEGTETGLRDAAIILIGSDALLRVGEIANLQISDIRINSNQVYLRYSKTDQDGEGAFLFIWDSTIAAIQAYRFRIPASPK